MSNDSNNTNNAIAEKSQQARPLDIYPHKSLRISDIAQQAYCEKQIDLWIQNPGELTSVPAGMEETAAGLTQLRTAAGGTNFHNEVSQFAVPTSWDEIEAELKQGRALTLLESLMM